ncbi:HNH endonuclease signature motif containing protein [Mycolicibacterium thermoresistibile]
MPGPLLAELIRTGATITALPPPPAEAEPRYRPSTALARYVRARDMRCCFPGCTAPAERCDIDHRIPWPHGPTHPANTGCFCRTHHLAKTFAGWQVTQAADGTLTWISPHQAVYRTTPGSRIIFPEWNTHTPLPHTPPATPEATPEAASHRGLAMPRRRRTRQADETSRINTARNANRLANQATEAKLAQTLGPLPTNPATGTPAPPQHHDPPPF